MEHGTCLLWSLQWQSPLIRGISALRPPRQNQDMVLIAVASHKQLTSRQWVFFIDLHVPPFLVWQTYYCPWKRSYMKHVILYPGSSVLWEVKGICSKRIKGDLGMPGTQWEQTKQAKEQGPQNKTPYQLQGKQKSCSKEKVIIVDCLSQQRMACTWSQIS